MGTGEMTGSIPAKAPTSGKAAKGLTGCGGCGCLFALTSLLAGAAMLGLGATDSKVDELIGPGALVLVLSVIIGFFALAVLIGGIVALRKARSREAAPGETPKPVVEPATQAGGAPVPGPPPDATPPQAPPGAPPPGPPPEW